MSRKWIDKEALLERARQLDSYAWADFASIVEEQPSFTAEQIAERESAEAAERLMAVQFCACDNPDACPLVAYERKERRAWQARAQRYSEDLDEIIFREDTGLTTPI